MKAVRRRAAGAQILMTEHVEQLWLTGYKCVLSARAGPSSIASRLSCSRTRNLCYREVVPLTVTAQRECSGRESKAMCP